MNDNNLPILKQWTLLNHGEWSQLSGLVYNDSRFADGDRIYTSALRVLGDKKATTRNTTYALGEPASKLITPPDHDHLAFDMKLDNF